jgi:hypothetical protein
MSQYEPNVEVRRLAGTPHAADDLPTGVTDKTVAFPGRTSLSRFGPQRKRTAKLPNMKNTKPNMYSTLLYLFQFLEWCKGFLSTFLQL